MALTRSEFLTAITQWGLNWSGTANDGKTVQNRIDELVARVAQLEATRPTKTEMSAAITTTVDQHLQATRPLMFSEP